MNQKLNNAVCDAAKADALMYAIEAAYIGVMFDDYDLLCKAESAFYALWDVIKKIQKDLIELEDLK